MSVYLGNKINVGKENLAIRTPVERLPAHETIGSLWSQAIYALKAGNPSPFKDLGINPSDKEAVAEMSNLLTQLDDDTLQISPLASGIFLLKKKDPASPTNEYKAIAVFKVGRKRAAMESSARQLAHLLGLNKHVISGMYCSMLGLPLYELVDDQDTTEDLWNGNQKVFEKNKPAQTFFPQPLQFDFDAEELDQSLSQDSTQEQKNSDSCSDDFTRTEDETSSKKSSSADLTQTGGEISWDKSDGESASKKSSSVTQTGDDISWDISDAADAPKKVVANKQSESAHGTTSFDSYNETPAIKVLPPPNLPISAFSTACAVVGIVQPFLFKEKEADVYEFTKMTMVALAIGLRDGKSDGFVGSKLYDIEDNFPMRIDPIYVNGRMTTSCALDLPYLDQDERTKKKLTFEQVDELHLLVSQWNLVDIVKKMGKLEILYRDTVCEKMDVDSSGKDEGNYEINILEGDDHAINGRLNAFENNSKLRILLPEQLNAMNTRLSRIRDFITRNKLARTTFSTEKLVDAVDLAGKIYKKRITAEVNTLPPSMRSTLKTSGPNHITGKVSPNDIFQQPITKVEIEQKARKALRTSGTPTSPRELSPRYENDLGISISPIDGDFNIPFFTENRKEEWFTNSPNGNGSLPFSDNDSMPKWDISFIETFSEESFSPTMSTNTLSHDDETDPLLSF